MFNITMHFVQNMDCTSNLLQCIPPKYMDSKSNQCIPPKYMDGTSFNFNTKSFLQSYSLFSPTHQQTKFISFSEMQELFLFSKNIISGKTEIIYSMLGCFCQKYLRYMFRIMGQTNIFSFIDAIQIMILCLDGHPGTRKLAS